MAYSIQYTPEAVKQLSKLDKPVAKKIVEYMKTVADNPFAKGKGLTGSLREFWRYRVGDYRVISLIKKETLIVLVVRAGHRKDVYE